jgi:hypothetical protein
LASEGDGEAHTPFRLAEIDKDRLEAVLFCPYACMWRKTSLESLKL